LPSGVTGIEACRFSALAHTGRSLGDCRRWRDPFRLIDRHPDVRDWRACRFDARLVSAYACREP
jgi:hypothetical protein